PADRRRDGGAALGRRTRAPFDPSVGSGALLAVGELGARSVGRAGASRPYRPNAEPCARGDGLESSLRVRWIRRGPRGTPGPRLLVLSVADRATRRPRRPHVE